MKHKALKTAVRSVLLSVLIYVILSFLIVMILYENLFSRKELYEYSVYLTYEDISLPYREITFDSDGFKLYGRVYHEDGTEGTVILGHGKDGSGEDLLAEARFFAENGFTALVFDLTGHGKSEGTTQRGLCRAAADMESAVRFCENDEQLSQKPIFLYGFGVSGYGAALCSSRDSVKAVAAVSAFSDVPKMTLEYACSNMGVLGYLEYPIMLLYQYILFGDELERSAVDEINASDTPVLAIHGTSDETVSFLGASLSAREAQITGTNFQTFTVEGGKHYGILRSEEAVAYLDSYNDAAYELFRQYNGEVPAYLIDQFYEQYDREKMSELNAEMMQQIVLIYKNSREVTYGDPTRFTQG